MSFQGRSSNFNRNITFTWSATATAAKLLIYITDGAGTIGAVLSFDIDGTLRSEVGLVNPVVTDIGIIPNGERHTVSVTVDRARSVYNVSVVKNSGAINRTNIPLEFSTFVNPAHPNVAFRYLTGGGSASYVINEVIISRRND